MDNNFKSGYVAVLGSPNAGKSTLINRFVGEKVSIVSPKPQTTRNRISGILTAENYQIVFEDTPGVVKQTSKLGGYMVKSIEGAGKGSDLILIVTDALKGLTESDRELIKKYCVPERKTLIAVNKTDKAEDSQVLGTIQAVSACGVSDDIYPVSAMKGEGCDELLKRIVQLLPQGVPFYPGDMITDRTERFMAAEIIREKMLYRYQQEIPHGIGINIIKFAYNEQKNITEIEAEIFCEKEGHKAILIGKGGSGLKSVGTSARAELEKMLDTSVYLNLWVKVKEKWRDSDFLLNELGYGKKDL